MDHKLKIVTEGSCYEALVRPYDIIKMCVHNYRLIKHVYGTITLQKTCKVIPPYKRRAQYYHLIKHVYSTTTIQNLSTVLPHYKTRAQYYHIIKHVYSTTALQNTCKALPHYKTHAKYYHIIIITQYYERYY